MILGNRAKQGVHGVAVAIVPEGGEGAALQFAAIAGAQMRAGQAEREFVLTIELENEGVGKGLADARRVDVAAIRRAAGATNRVPVGIEGLRARHLHRSGPHLESIGRPVEEVRRAFRQLQNAARKARLKNS
ncbi:hypothetical protein D3C87_1519060 [compost metagenome]